MARSKLKRLSADAQSFAVTVSGVSVKCYAGRDGRWFVTYSVAGKRRTVACRTEEAARTKATQIAGAVHDQKAVTQTLSGKDLAAYTYVVKALAPLGVPLSSAIHEYVAAREKLRGKSINEAVEFYCRQNLVDMPQKTIEEIGEEMIEAKRRDGRSELYTRDLSKRLPHVSKAFPGPIIQVTRAKIEDWLRSLPMGPTSRNNYRSFIVTLWNFAKQCGYLPRDRFTEADSLSRAKETGSEIGIFRPDELATLLAKANSNLLPFLAIGAFTGLRHAELLRLEWEDVRFAQGFVEVKAKKSKTAQRRLVPIQPNLAAWIAPYEGRTGKICPWVRIGRTASTLAKDLGLRWPDNVLRHSYASYRLAQCQDAAKVSLEMGNSPQMIFRHYRELVTPQDAAAWWSISPKQAANVVLMSKHQASA